MKRFTSILLGAMSVCTLSLSAQNLDRENLPALKYVRLPLQPLDTTVVKTYKVNVITQDDNPYTRDLVLSKIGLDGFKRVRDVEADLTITVEVYPFIHGERTAQTKETKVKKDGVEQTVTTYYYTSDFTGKTTCRIQNAAGEEIFSQEAGGKQYITGRDCNTYKEALAAYNSTKETVVSETSNNYLTTLRNSMNSQFGYSIATANFMAFKIKPKKFAYDDFNSAFPLFQAAVSSYDASKGLSEEQAKNVMTGIEALQKELAQYVPDDKKARVDKDVASAALYNVCVANFILRKYDEALDALSKAEQIRKGIGWADLMESVSSDMSKRAKANIK